MREPGVYPTDVSDEEWAFVAPYLCLMKQDAPQRQHSLRAVFDALRYMVRAGCPWRLLPNDLPPWQIVHQQATRWLAAGVFEAMTHDLRMILRLVVERPEQPTAAVLDARTLQGSVESGPRSGYDGHKKRKGAKVHLAVDTLGHLLAAHVSPANENERAHVDKLLASVQEATGESVQVAYVDMGFNGEATAAVAASHGIDLQVVSLPWPRKASCSCPGAGWSNAPLPGWHAVGGWPGTTNGWARRWQACTSSLLPCSCSPVSLLAALGRVLKNAGHALDCLNFSGKTPQIRGFTAVR